MRVADALFDTGSAMSMRSVALYARLPNAPAIQPVLRAAFKVVDVGNASAVIRGYVNVHVEVAGVAVRHLLLVGKGLPFLLIINTDILRAHCTVLTLDKSAPMRLQIRECAVCREQRTSSPVEPLASPRAAPQRVILCCAFIFFVSAASPSAVASETRTARIAFSTQCPCAAVCSIFALVDRKIRAPQNPSQPSLVCVVTFCPSCSKHASDALFTLVTVRVSPLSCRIAYARAPILVCLRISATLSPIARALAAESLPLTPAFRSTQATRSPLLVSVQVSVPTFPLARAPATESRPQVSASRRPKATRAPLLVPILVSVFFNPFARARGFDFHPHLSVDQRT